MSTYLVRLRELPLLVEVYCQAYHYADQLVGLALHGTLDRPEVLRQLDLLHVAVETRLHELRPQVAQVAEVRSRRLRQELGEVAAEGVNVIAVEFGQNRRLWPTESPVIEP